MVQTNPQIQLQQFCQELVGHIDMLTANPRKPTGGSIAQEYATSFAIEKSRLLETKRQEDPNYLMDKKLQNKLDAMGDLTDVVKYLTCIPA